MSMWKERYKVGIDLIDSRHKQLFDTTEKLILIIDGEGAVDKKQECADMVTFLKNYAAEHFAEEEEYQLSISYSDIDRHKALHRVFAATVLKLEQKLIAADFSVSALKEVAGFLTSWLTYHVVGIDQKLRKKELLEDQYALKITSFIDCFEQSAIGVLETMTGITDGKITRTTYQGNEDDVRIMVGLIGDHLGEAFFTFTKEFTLNLIDMMTSIKITAVDELAYSALSEMTNIISGNASSLIAGSGIISDIKTPVIISDFKGVDNRSGFFIDTALGCMAVSVNVG